MEHFAATIYVGKLEPDSPMGTGYYWSVAQSEGGGAMFTGVESTRLKAWRKACRVARDDCGPVS